MFSLLVTFVSIWNQLLTEKGKYKIFGWVAKLSWYRKDEGVPTWEQFNLHSIFYSWVVVILATGWCSLLFYSSERKKIHTHIMT
jgi:hypothetical protein